jgi:hypothetical protein
MRSAIIGTKGPHEYFLKQPELCSEFFAAMQPCAQYCFRDTTFPEKDFWTFFASQFGDPAIFALQFAHVLHAVSYTANAGIFALKTDEGRVSTLFFGSLCSKFSSEYTRWKCIPLDPQTITQQVKVLACRHLEGPRIERNTSLAAQFEENEELHQQLYMIAEKYVHATQRRKAELHCDSAGVSPAVLAQRLAALASPPVEQSLPHCPKRTGPVTIDLTRGASSSADTSSRQGTYMSESKASAPPVARDEARARSDTRGDTNPTSRYQDRDSARDRTREYDDDRSRDSARDRCQGRDYPRDYSTDSESVDSSARMPARLSTRAYPLHCDQGYHRHRDQGYAQPQHEYSSSRRAHHYEGYGYELLASADYPCPLPDNIGYAAYAPPLYTPQQLNYMAPGGAYYQPGGGPVPLGAVYDQNRSVYGQPSGVYSGVQPMYAAGTYYLLPVQEPYMNIGMLFAAAPAATSPPATIASSEVKPEFTPPPPHATADKLIDWLYALPVPLQTHAFCWFKNAQRDDSMICQWNFVLHWVKLFVICPLRTSKRCVLHSELRHLLLMFLQLHHSSRSRLL